MARARSRKRRPTGAKRAPAGGNGATPAGDAAGAATAGAVSAPTRARSNRDAGAARATRRNQPTSARRTPPSPAAPTYGERPNAPWHPLPLSELLILIGAIGAALGLARTGHGGFANGGSLLLAGLAAVALGTIEVTLREHRSGYRSHTVMLAALAVLLFDTVLVLALTAITSLPRAFTVVLVALDMALFAVCFKVLRARFLDARHARVVREG
ncbi:MAG TPA: hypothetical protein VNV37_11485 [Solirubrobacteraceae bacterium]|nr:hypothetical protein [Solirubrobacteraceae bacterium]